MSYSQELDLHQRYRYSPHTAALRVQLIRSDTAPMRLQTVGMSMEGMHVECDRARAQLLAPPDIGEGQQFTARVELFEPAIRNRTLTLGAIVTSICDLDQDRYWVGFQFSRFFGKSQRLLQAFLSNLENNSNSIQSL